ncbi:MAG: HEPN domain-containing protein [Desulfamplus sp.]|nr:HEPN domain-containing protein [Desulfamplus sp.]
MGNDKIQYWSDLSDYDIDTAEAMLNTKRYLYVGFMTHQSIEKTLKAYYVKIHNETAPSSHNLSYLAKKSGLYEEFTEDQKAFTDILEPMNIECRYPAYKDRLFQSLTDERCKEILKNTKELQEWIKQRL